MRGEITRAVRKPTSESDKVLFIRAEAYVAATHSAEYRYTVTLLRRHCYFKTNKKKKKRIKTLTHKNINRRIFFTFVIYTKRYLRVYYAL